MPGLLGQNARRIIVSSRMATVGRNRFFGNQNLVIRSYHPGGGFQQSLSSYSTPPPPPPSSSILSPDALKIPPLMADVTTSKKTKEPIQWPSASTASTAEKLEPIEPDYRPTEAEFNPSLADYNPDVDSYWTRGQQTPYYALATTLSYAETLSGRNEAIRTLRNYFRTVLSLNPDDLLPSVYLCLNQVGPSYEGMELGVGQSTIMSAISGITRVPLSEIKAKTTGNGDLASVAYDIWMDQDKQPTDTLTVGQVLTKLRAISGVTGKFRTGIAESSIITALANAFSINKLEKNKKKFKQLRPIGMKKKLDQDAETLNSALCECPNIERIIRSAVAGGLETVHESCYIAPGVPIRPMLAKPAKGIDEIFTRFGEHTFTCEYKYDGERSQIHFWRTESGQCEVRIYSRNMESYTERYPEIIRKMPLWMNDNIDSCIIDAEIVAWDATKQSILPFQILSKRKRKNVVEADLAVQVCVFPFDLLYVNGESMTKKSFFDRRAAMWSKLSETAGQFMFATHLDTKDVDEIAGFLDTAIKGNCEGLMIKTLHENATYEIAKRSRNWLKLKKDYLEGIGDTLDLVVIGGFYGAGKRANNYGAYLLACYDPTSERYQSICRIGTGFSADNMDEFTVAFDEIRSESRPDNYEHDYVSADKPDEWFKPMVVWEVKTADLSLSPRYRAAMDLAEKGRGISLRFPRFVRIRDDKKPTDATTSQQICDMYNNQDLIKNQKTSSSNEAANPSSPAAAAAADNTYSVESSGEAESTKVE